jgi:mannose-1-phosphate guanylyltransferase
MKRRVSLSIDSKIIKDIDSLVDGNTILSRSDAIEKILRQHVTDRKTAVVLAGGDPEKIFVKEMGIYRPLIPVGKKTLIEDIVLKCREAGFSNILIVGFSIVISKIYEVLGNGEKDDVNITYIEETKALGSAKTIELVKKYINSDFLFLPCDHYFGFDLKKLYDFHLEHNGTVTLGVHTGTGFDWNTSVVVMDGYNIIDYEEFPKKPKTHLISIFIGFMKPDVFDNIPPGEVAWSLQQNVFPKLAKDGKVVGYPISGEWVNVHTKSDMIKLNKLRRTI